MTVSSSTDRATFLGNGVAQIFPLPFRFFANSEIQAWLVTNSTGALTALSLGTHYTLSGAGDPEVDGNPTSELTMLTAPTALQSLFVQRVIPATQPTDIVNQGRFFPEIHENVFDRLTMLIQQANGESRGAIRVAVGDPEPTRLASALSRANLLMGFDSNGDPIAVAPISGDVSEFAMNLANSSDPTKGAAMVGFQGGTVDDFIGECIVLKPGATTADLVAAIATGRVVVIPEGLSITVDNTAGPGLTVSADNVRIRGKGALLATSDEFDLLRVTGRNFRINGVVFEGPGTYRPDLGGGGEPPALLQFRGDDCVAGGCNFINPYGAGVFVRGAAGCRVINNDFSSGYAGSIAQPFLFHVYLRVASDTLVQGNTVVGSIQGICGGGDGSGTVTVVGKNGLVTSSLRNTLINENTCAGQLDHSIYISNDSVQTTIHNNQVACVNDLIKIEGGPNIVTNNRGVGGSGITGRNVLNTLIDGNVLITTLSSVTAYGILLYEQIFKRPINDVTISNNILTCQGAESKGAIYVIGDVWDGYQSVIKSLKIHGNTCVGYGATSEGFQIGVFQTLFAGSPVTGALGTNVSIKGNVCEFPAHTVATYGIDLGRGLQGGVVEGNTLRGFRSIGVRLLGVQDFNLSGNTLIADPEATGVFGFNERGKDLTLHYNSQGNRYGQNTYKGTFARQVQHSDETCYNSDRVIVRRTGGLSSDTVIATLWPKQYVFNNHTADAVITLDALESGPWPIDSDITITNAAAANSLTVNPGGFAVAAGTSLRLVCTGSNAFIKAN